MLVARFVLGFCVLCALSLVGVSVAYGQQRACLNPASLPNETASELLAALQIETRKSSAPWIWARSGPNVQCTATLSVEWPTQAQLLAEHRPDAVFDLRVMHSETLARSLASSVLSALQAASESPEDVALLSTEPLPTLPTPAVVRTPDPNPKPPPSEPSSMLWTLRVGGVYDALWNMDQAAQGLSVETGPSWFNHALSLSVALHTFGSEDFDTEGVVATFESTDLLMVARGGVRFDAFVLRAGLGAGLRLQSLSFRSSGERDRDVDTSQDLGLFAADLELLWVLSPRWHLAALLHTRAFSGSRDSLWLGEVAFPALSGSTGGQIALGFTF